MAVSWNAWAEKIHGIVTDVIDGDTVRVMTRERLPGGAHAEVIGRSERTIGGRRAVVTRYLEPGSGAHYVRYEYPGSGEERWYRFSTVRLEGIDAPELGQVGGEAAREALARKVGGKEVTVEVKERDVYGRVVGEVRRKRGSEVGRELVREGAAYRAPWGSSEQGMEEAERMARKERRGVWGTLKGERPWTYRRRVAEGEGKDHPQSELGGGKRGDARGWGKIGHGPHEGESGGRVYVRGYTRRDGTHVSGYWRSRPTSGGGGGTTVRATSSESGTVSVRGYYRADGTYVRGYTRSAPSRGSGRSK